MKKRSKVFLIVSAIIFAVGLIICLVGVLVASGDGEQIYSAKIGDDRGYVYNFGDGKTDKIRINVTDANVNIYGKSDKSCVEVLNFNENLCSYSGNNAMITFREATQVDDITGMWENGLSFKGLRYVLRPVPADKEKTVNIYLESEEQVKVFDIKVARGNVTVKDLSISSDYNISLESGKVIFENVKTDSSIDVTATGDISTDVIFDGVSADIMTLTAKRAKFTSDKVELGECEMNVTVGSASLEFVPKSELYTVDIATKGKLTVDGGIYPDRYTYPENDGSQTEEPDEETAVSSIKIAGDDFSVNLVTPEKEKQKIRQNKVIKWNTNTEQEAFVPPRSLLSLKTAS